MSRKKTVLIAGGSGFLGQSLAHQLTMLGYQVNILTRNLSNQPIYQEFTWDLREMSIDRAALQNVDVVINLAGASIAGSLWTKRRKQILLRSRVKANELLAREIKAMQQELSTFIGASGVHYYGDRGLEVVTEDASPGRGFLSDLCEKWEDSQEQFSTFTNQLIKLRMGMVLGRKGGAFPLLSRTVIGGIGTYLGDGRQYLPWIHVQDVVQLIAYFIDHPSVDGAINVVAPDPVTNQEFMRHIVNIKGGLNIMIGIPSPVLRLALGEMAAIVLDGARVVPSKVVNETDYKFTFGDLPSALKDLLT